jgi:hypothetical protein
MQKKLLMNSTIFFINFKEDDLQTNLNVLKFENIIMKKYFFNRQQSIKIYGITSVLLLILLGVSQGSGLEPKLLIC